MADNRKRLFCFHIEEQWSVVHTNNMPYLSVIIPVYNVEPYLRECLDAVIHQTMQEIEIIITDDGSTDASGTICDEYAANDSRISVIHQENQGLSMARNSAMKIATGQYWMFVDGDDIPNPRFCEDAYRMIKEQDADIVNFQYRIIPKDVNHTFPSENRMLTSDEALYGIIDGTVSVIVWDKIYRRELFDGISFPKGMLFEDIGTTYKLLGRAERIFLSTKVLYTYRIREGSICQIKSKEANQQWRQMYREMSLYLFRRFSKEETLSSRNEMIIYAMNCAIKFEPKDNPEIATYVDRILHKRSNYKAMPSWKRRILFGIYLYFNPLFHLLCKLWGKRK